MTSDPVLFPVLVMVADMHNAQGDNNAANAGGDVAVAANANSQEAGANQAPPAESPAAGNAPAQAAAAAAAADSTSAAAAASTAPAAAAAAPSAASAAAAAADDESDDDEAETVEESPCSRWLKRKEEVRYRDVPGIDTAFLAMDSEEGVEVVWNEAQFSTTKKFKAQEDKLKNVFEALTLIEHPNIVKFHKFWTDPGSVDERTGERRLPRVRPPIALVSVDCLRKLYFPPLQLIFITEYMSSGSLKQFLRRTKKNNRKIQLQSWKRWCTQILSALRYEIFTCCTCVESKIINLCVLYEQLPSPDVQSHHHPRQPHLRHHLHPAQRAGQDRVHRPGHHPPECQDLPRGL